MTDSKPSLASIFGQMVGMFDRMPAVVETEDGSVWREMTEPGDAITVGNTSHAGMGTLFHKEFYLEGGHPRRWFVLLDNATGRQRCALVVSVLPEGVTETGDLGIPRVHISRGRKKDAEPDYGAKIAALSAAIGIDLVAGR